MSILIMSILILIFLVTYVHSSNRGCTHTDIFMKQGLSNNDNFYFDPETIPMRAKDKSYYCLTNVTDYIKNVTNNYKCNGLWCNSSTESYVFDQIITKESFANWKPLSVKANLSDECFESCSMNYAMIYDKWNDKSKSNWCERTLVFGDTILWSLHYIQLCCNIFPPYTPETPQPSPITPSPTLSKLYEISLAALVICFVVTACLCCMQLFPARCFPAAVEKNTELMNKCDTTYKTLC